MKAVAEAPGKVIISGEHFVVHGATAIAAAIQRKVRVEAIRSDRLSIDSRLRDREALKPARRVVESLYKANRAEPRVSITITSELAEGAGLGSSAATMVAIAGATSALEGWDLDERALAKAGEAGEKLVHGNPSGIDATASATGGVILFKRGEGPRRVDLPRPFTLMVAFSGRRRNTGRLVTKVSGMKEAYPSLFASLCESATLVSGLCADALQRGDAAALGSLMTYSHAVLTRAGASNKRLDRLVDLCLSSGCLGAKLTGAGGGGSVLAVPPPGAEEGRAVAERLTREGYDTFFTDLPRPRSEVVDGVTRSPQGRPVVVKLGGSVITDKKVAFSYREKAVRGLGRAIAGSGLPVIVVHGGGSFGHTVARKYGLSSSRSSPSPDGVSETREAMLALDAKVCASLSSAGLHPYPFSPFTLLDREGDAGSGFIDRLLTAGMTPVTFGDVVHDGRGFRILSGDTMCVELAEMLGASRCVMAIDVDGILDGKGASIKVLGEGAQAKLPASSGDATGGIKLKVSEAERMASSGTEVRLVSGLRPAEFSKALRGVGFHGTTVKVPHGVSSG